MKTKNNNDNNNCTSDAKGTEYELKSQIKRINTKTTHVRTHTQTKEK